MCVNPERLLLSHHNRLLLIVQYVNAWCQRVGPSEKHLWKSHFFFHLLVQKWSRSSPACLPAQKCFLLQIYGAYMVGAQYPLHHYFMSFFLFSLSPRYVKFFELLCSHRFILKSYQLSLAYSLTHSFADWSPSKLFLLTHRSPWIWLATASSTMLSAS